MTLRILSLLFLLTGSSLLAKTNEAIRLERRDLGSFTSEIWEYFGEPTKLVGTVQDDLFAYAPLAELTGTYEDDVWFFAGRTTFTGQANDDLRLGGLEVVTVNGSVEDCLYAFAFMGNLVVDTNTIVNGDALLSAQQHATVRGTFHGDVEVSAQTVTIDADIRGSLLINGTEVTVLPDTRIGGDVTYHTPTSPITDTNQVAGTISAADGATQDSMNALALLIRIIQIVAALLSGLVMLRFLPRFSGNAVEIAYQRRGPSILFGGVSCLMFGSLIFLTLASRFAIGFGIVMSAVFFVFMYFGKLVIALAIGAAVLRNWRPFTFGRLSVALIVGLLILYSAFTLPYIGTTLWLITSCWGMGSMMQVIASSQRNIKVEVPASMLKDDEEIL